MRCLALMLRINSSFGKALYGSSSRLPIPVTRCTRLRSHPIRTDAGEALCDKGTPEELLLDHCSPILSWSKVDPKPERDVAYKIHKMKKSEHDRTTPNLSVGVWIHITNALIYHPVVKQNKKFIDISFDITVFTPLKKGIVSQSLYLKKSYEIQFFCPSNRSDYDWCICS
jgi:hypothetical protein